MKIKGRAVAPASPRSSPRKTEAVSPRSSRRNATTAVNGGKSPVRTPAKRQKLQVKVEEVEEEDEGEMIEAPEEEEEEIAEEKEYPEQEEEEGEEGEEMAEEGEEMAEEGEEMAEEGEEMAEEGEEMAEEGEEMAEEGHEMGEEGQEMEEEAEEMGEGGEEEAEGDINGEEVEGEEQPAEADPTDTVYDWIDEETYVPKAEPNIMSHVRRHLFKGMIIYICKICEKGFDSMASLAKHIGRKHAEVPVRYSEGDYNDDGRPKKKGRKRLSNSTPRGQIKREGKSTGTPGERQFPCPHCTHWAMTKEALRVHIYTHTGERHHVCNVCGNKFTQRASLNRHMATHTGEKRHKCPICEKRFIQKCSLDRHMDTHQGIKRYKCDVCGEQYSQSYPLSKHIKKKHPEYWAEFNEDRRYMPRNTPLNQRMSDNQVELATPIQLFNEPGEEEQEEEMEQAEEQGEGIVVEMEEEQEVAPVISMPNASRMEKKKATVRKSMIQLKSAEDVMNLFEDVVVGPIEIAPIKGEEGEEEIEGEVENGEEMEAGEEQLIETSA